MSNENEIQASFERLMDEYGFDQDGRPTPLIIRAFNEGVLSPGQLARLQDYFAQYPDDLAEIDDEEVPLPPEWESTADEIVRRVLGAPPEPGEAPVWLLECLTREEREQILRPQDLALTRSQRSDAPRVTEFLVDTSRTSALLSERLRRMETKTESLRFRIEGMPAAAEAYFASVRMSQERELEFRDTIASAMALMLELLKDAPERVRVSVPSDESALAVRLGDLISLHKEEYVEEVEELRTERRARWKDLEPSIRERLTRPWSVLIPLLFEALRDGERA